MIHGLILIGQASFIKSMYSVSYIKYY